MPSGVAAPEAKPMSVNRRTLLVKVGGAAVGILGLAVAFASAAAPAADVSVAVASNFTEPAKEIAIAFQAKTHIHVALGLGSSGRLYEQISQGGPYEVFLSADSDRPAQAEKAGLAVPGTRFTYAIGTLVLYSRTPGLVDGKGAVLASGKFRKLAIPDPAVMAYGAAAVQTMTKHGVYETLKPKIVHGASVPQTYQMIHSGSADLGFVALSQVIKETGGSRWLVPDADHAPITQQAVLLKAGQNDPAAKEFLAFLKSPEALKIIKHYGYEVR
jgi:molybdate transport system substrate-binding protein